MLQCPSRQNSPADSPIARVIQSYNQDVLYCRVQCLLQQCPRCGHKSDGKIVFRRHAVRCRILLVIVEKERLVHRIEYSSVRWRCPACKGTFTDHPSFAIPYKQYTSLQMREYARRYVLNDRVTYRKGVTVSEKLIFHDYGNVASVAATEEEKQNEVLPILSHSTLYRWVTTLGRANNFYREGFYRIEPEKSDPVLPPRDLSTFTLAPRKYRSQARKKVLKGCRNF